MSEFCIFTYIIISVWAFIAIFCNKHAIDLYTVFYFFVLFFLGIAPLAQYINKVFPAPLYEETSEESFLYANVLIIISLIIFEVIYRIFYEKKSTVQDNAPLQQNNNIKPALLFWPVLLFAVLVFLHSQAFNLDNILFRGGSEEVDRSIEVQSSALIVGGFLRYIIPAAFVFYYLAVKKYNFTFIFCALTVLLCCCPAGMARLGVTPIYLPIIMIMFPVILRHRYFIKFSFVGGLLFVFPFLDLFRRKNINWDDFSICNFEMFQQLHFDSYASFASVIHWEEITWGKQALSALLFWVPRRIWQDKAIGSGAYMAEKYDLGFANFSNISMNFLGEGYINFGIIGVVIWIVIIAVLCGKMDHKFWIEYKGNTQNTFAVYYMVFMGLLIFILRGDMMSSTAYTCGFLCAYKFTETFCFKKIYSIPQQTSPMES